MVLRVYNTLTRQKEDFEPLEPGRAGLYVCGVTTYAPAHIGHARCFVAFDVLARWLEQSGYALTYVRNFTDVDDKIIRKARETNEDPFALASRYVVETQTDMDRLGCRRPDIEPRVTEHINEIVDTIEKIEGRGLAYRVEGDVYFEVSKDPAYGRLSGRSDEDLAAGARVDVDERKHSPRDFALWKSAKPGEPSWPSPFGDGRPGWHIECSAMAAKYLGATFDIHGGGKDLVFPHHENELAQSCAAHATTVLARYWMHNGFINLVPESCPRCGAEGEVVHGPEGSTACPSCSYVYSEDDLKMSKSRGNFYPIGEVMDRTEPEALRLLFLNTHYRKPIQFSMGLLDDAERRLDKNYETLAAFESWAAAQKEGARRAVPPSRKKAESRTDLATPDSADSASILMKLTGTHPKRAFQEAMDDDLNTSKAIAEMAEVFRIVNDVVRGLEKERFGRKLTPAERESLAGEVRELTDEARKALGLWKDAPDVYLSRRRAVRARARGLDPVRVEAMLEERRAARKAKDFARADELRDELVGQGVILMDAKDGRTEWDVADDAPPPVEAPEADKTT